ncbi:MULTISPECIES: ATP-binding protein [unclassified Streptomyces]|uniref:ATP-binding protein n=1 Tax=unclassified Streptomyces TaxID=2593676 RepID=UPI00203528AD|nr:MULTISPECIES: ATP-binding protein [unclassified Streptomyces]
MSENYRTGATKSTAGAGRVRRGPRSPAEARGAVRRVLSEQSRTRGTACTPDTLSDALLVASELTTNAMLHGGGVTDFDVEVVGQNLYLSVSDRERRRPVMLDPVDRHGRRRCSGRGWPIVCRLSRTVLVSDLPAGGKRVTAVIPLCGDSPVGGAPAPGRQHRNRT